MTDNASRPDRIQRSELAVPATSTQFFEKAARGQADSIFLDLEDAVAPSRRAEARANAVAALGDIDWGTKIMSVRVNGLGTEWGLSDILAVAKCPRLDLVLIPKVETTEDVRFVERLLEALERETPREKPLGIEILIETTKGLANVEAIAAASSRLEAIIFGVGDYSIELENFDTVFGAPNPDYQVGGAANDIWHFALARIANACRAYGLRPIDGPFANYGDAQAYRESAIRARALGYEGKWAIHPSQVAIANDVYSPSAAHISWAEDIGRRMDSEAAAGSGALGIGGILIDRAHVKLAGKILARAALMGKLA